MKNKFIPKTLPFISILALFAQFVLYDLMFDPIIKWATVSVLFVLLLLDTIVRLIQGLKNNKNHLIANSFGITSFLLYHLRNLLDQLFKASISKEATYIPRIKEFILALIILTSFIFLIFKLLILLNESRGNEHNLNFQKQSLVQNFVINFFILLLVVVGINYIAVMRNYNFDLSSTGKFSFQEISKKILKDVNKKVEIYAFYPRPLEGSSDASLSLVQVRPDLQIILDQLKSINSLIEVKFINADVETDLIADLGQVSNGNILIRTMKNPEDQVSGNVYAEQTLGVKKKEDLADFERKLIQAIVNVSTKEKIIYFSESNGERFSPLFNSLPNQRISKLIGSMSFLNFKIKNLEIKNNWPNEIPQDADIIALIGPTTSYSEVAKKTIEDYIFNRNGKVLIAIDPLGKEDFQWLLSKMHLSYNNTTLSQLANQPGILVTNTIQKHPIEEGMQYKAAGVVFPYSGFFEKNDKDKSDKPLEYFTLLESDSQSYPDKNSDAIQDKDEISGRHKLGIIIDSPVNKPKEKENKLETKEQTIEKSDQKPPQSEKKEESIVKEEKSKLDTNLGYRVLMYSGVAWLTDQYFSYNANSELAVMSVTWMFHNKAIQSIQPKEDKVDTINLSDRQKKIVWILCMFVYPGIITLLSFLLVYRRKKLGIRN